MSLNINVIVSMTNKDNLNRNVLGPGRTPSISHVKVEIDRLIHEIR